MEAFLVLLVVVALPDLLQAKPLNQLYVLLLTISHGYFERFADLIALSTLVIFEISDLLLADD